jgi:antitoxin ParD1/3/4
MNVNLGETFDLFVAELVESGTYQTQSEVIREGLRMLKNREDARKAQFAELKRQVQIGIDQIKRGETSVFDVEEIKREGRRLLAEKNKGRK